MTFPPINLWSVWNRPQPTRCVYKCRLDPHRQYCLGCNRTLQEIVEAGNTKRFDKET